MAMANKKHQEKTTSREDDAENVKFNVESINDRLQLTLSMFIFSET